MTTTSAAALPSGMNTKNTFLDCRSPWIGYVTLDWRPSSDPTDDRVSINSTSQRIADTSTSEGSNCFEDQEPGVRRLMVEGAAQQKMVQLAQQGEDRRTKMSRTQRRRAQRKLMRAFQAELMDPDDSPSGTPDAAGSSSGEQESTSTKISL
ncbi:unnamed protein product [Prorocentrum cordatum]|uniref:Uncharacterized protein n=1 Tax=Prorocentrum cordatum TaxID=2364126 RepID=A0ABN9U6N1_9DINO|nr:unnamed protein product [Polarella glacialis]